MKFLRKTGETKMGVPPCDQKPYRLFANKTSATPFNSVTCRFKVPLRPVKLVVSRISMRVGTTSTAYRHVNMKVASNGNIGLKVNGGCSVFDKTDALERHTVGGEVVPLTIPAPGTNDYVMDFADWTQSQPCFDVQSPVSHGEWELTFTFGYTYSMSNVDITDCAIWMEVW